jgi:hypothetical protein
VFALCRVCALSLCCLPVSWYLVGGYLVTDLHWDFFSYFFAALQLVYFVHPNGHPDIDPYLFAADTRVHARALSRASAGGGSSGGAGGHSRAAAARAAALHRQHAGGHAHAHGLGHAHEVPGKAVDDIDVAVHSKAPPQPPSHASSRATGAVDSKEAATGPVVIGPSPPTKSVSIAVTPIKVKGAVDDDRRAHGPGQPHSQPQQQPLHGSASSPALSKMALEADREAGAEEAHKDLPWHPTSRAGYWSHVRFYFLLVSDKLLICFIFYVGTYRADFLSMGYVFFSLYLLQAKHLYDGALPVAIRQWRRLHFYNLIGTHTVRPIASVRIVCSPCFCRSLFVLVLRFRRASFVFLDGVPNAVHSRGV